MSLSLNYGSVSPSLLLDFAATKRLDPRITFTRASTGTFYDANTTAKAEENLLLQSQAWATTPWFVNIGGSVTAVNNSASAPDTTTTATSLTFSAQFGSQAQSVTTISGLSYTFSFWAKRISGNTALHINHFDSATSSNTAFTITNDWVRYSVTVLGKSGGGAVQFGVQDRNASGFGEILVWGAQLEQRSAVTAYTPTTTQPITNYVPVLLTAQNNVARFEHNPVTRESLGLEIEEQRTNLLTYSDDFADAAWAKTRASITSNTIVAPDGTLTGDKLVEDTTASNTHVTSQAFSATSGTTYTTSLFVKAAERTEVVLQFQGGFTTTQVRVNLATGAVINTAGTPINSGVISVGNGWYRVFVSQTATSTATSNVFVYISVGGTTVYTGDGYSGFFIWGAQLEAGAFPTSYIPTVASQVTRSADAASMTGTNFSSWYNAGEGTLYAEGLSSQTTAGPNGFASIEDGTTNNRIQLRRAGQNLVVSDANIVVANGTVQASFTGTPNSWLVNTFAKTALAYKVNDIATTLNAGTTQTDTAAIIPVVNQMLIGSGTGIVSTNGTIKKLAYYPLRLTNTQLQALTTV
jgi:hypothetical protein